jgi:molybdopterin-guanine dinucleotide biosynthesis protein A
MIENQIESKNYKVSDLFDHVTVKIKHVPTGCSDSFYDFFNINTPEDVQEAEMIMKNDEDGR